MTSPLSLGVRRMDQPATMQRLGQTAGRLAFRQNNSKPANCKSGREFNHCRDTFDSRHNTVHQPAS